MLKDPYTSLEVIIKIGFERILTSGQDSSALEGLQTITHLIEKVFMGSKFPFSKSCLLVTFSYKIVAIAKKFGHWKKKSS